VSLSRNARSRIVIDYPPWLGKFEPRITAGIRLIETVTARILPFRDAALMKVSSRSVVSLRGAPRLSTVLKPLDVEPLQRDNAVIVWYII
jgi:hypothetical protein